MNPILQEFLLKLRLEGKEASEYNYKLIIQKYMEFLAERLEFQGEIPDITVEMLFTEPVANLQAYIEKYVPRGAGIWKTDSSYINLVIRCLHQFYLFMIRTYPEAYEKQDPFIRIEKPLVIMSKTSFPADAYKLYAQYIYDIHTRNQERDQAIIVMLTTMGLKLDDVCNLEIGDLRLFSPEGCYLTIDGRKLPVNEPCKNAILNYLEVRNALPTNAAALFLSTRLKKMHRTSIEHMLKVNCYHDDPESYFSATTMRKYAMHCYKKAGGGNYGLRHYFGLQQIPDGHMNNDFEAYTQNDFTEYLLDHKVLNLGAITEDEE